MRAGWLVQPGAATNLHGLALCRPGSHLALPRFGRHAGIDTASEAPSPDGQPEEDVKDDHQCGSTSIGTSVEGEEDGRDVVEGDDDQDEERRRGVLVSRRPARCPAARRRGTVLRAGARGHRKKRNARAEQQTYWLGMMTIAMAVSVGLTHMYRTRHALRKSSRPMSIAALPLPRTHGYTSVKTLYARGAVLDIKLRAVKNTLPIAARRREWRQAPVAPDADRQP